MRRPLALASLFAVLAGARPAAAERVVRDISWSALKADGKLAGGEILPGNLLRVANPDGAPRTVPLFALDAPGVRSSRYEIRGEVRGAGLEGTGYLEMWSFFPGGGRYFSRTLASAGPMRSLSGTFDARPFLLPFTAEPGMAPERLAVSVAFGGKGSVTLGKVQLAELDSGDEFGAVPGAWLSPSEVGRAGSIVGGVLGTLGALVGVLASRRIARPVVMALLYFALGVGVLSLFGAAAAWWAGQPRDVTYGLTLLGVIAIAVPGSLLGHVKRQYEEVELRRMKALDVG